MKRIVKSNPLSNITLFDENRKGAKYSLNNGESYMNHGEYIECVTKAVLGYEPHKDANTPYDMDSDIPELNASVKSFNCGLCDRKLSKDFSEFVNIFFANVHSTMFIWTIEKDNMVYIYFMDTDEFKSFVDTFASWDGYAQKVRFKVCDNKTKSWLDARA